MFDLRKRGISKELYGSLSIFASAFCFYLATVAVRWGTAEGVALSIQLMVFARFLIGFLVILTLFIFSIWVTIKATIEASNGRSYHYPLCIKIVH